MDLSTTYMGLKLRNPIVPSASPLSRSIDSIRHMEDMGAGAVVMYSLFEEQIVHESLALDHFISYGSNSYAEALSYFPTAHEFNLGPNEYLEHLFRAKQAVNIPIIASLNGVSLGGWIDYARLMEQAGADGLELNLYFLATNPEMSAQAVEQDYVDVLKAVKATVRIPVAMKLSPFVSAFPNFARRLVDAGANGLVLFNRFYQPDLDLEELEVTPRLVLSSSQELRLPLRWTALLYGKVKADLALTTGVHTAEDAIKAIMAGANAVMSASALLKGGPEAASNILADMQTWMEAHEYHSVERMRGSMSQGTVCLLYTSPSPRDS